MVIEKRAKVNTVKADSSQEAIDNKKTGKSMIISTNCEKSTTSSSITFSLGFLFFSEENYVTNIYNEEILT